MAVYKYRCRTCGHIDVFMAGITAEDDRIACTKCRSNDLERIYSGIAVLGKKASSTGTCCGSSTPCSAPKHCCGGK